MKNACLAIALSLVPMLGFGRSEGFKDIADFRTYWKPALSDAELKAFLPVDSDQGEVEVKRNFSFIKFGQDFNFRGLFCKKEVIIQASAASAKFKIRIPGTYPQPFCEFKGIKFFGRAEFEKSISPTLITIHGAGRGKKYQLAELEVNAATVVFGFDDTIKPRLRSLGVADKKFFVLGPASKNPLDLVSVIFREPVTIQDVEYPKGTVLSIEYVQDTESNQIGGIGIPEGKTVSINSVACRGEVVFASGVPTKCGESDL